MFGVLLLMAPAYKIAEMAVGYKSFPDLPSDESEGPVGTLPLSQASPRFAWRPGLEILWVYGLLESVLWTARSLGHSLLIAVLAISPIWLTLRGRYSLKELGFAWPSRTVTRWILVAGTLIALAFPLAAVLSGHPVPANPDWPTWRNILPYILWAFFQQFLLQSFFFLRFESVLGSTAAVWLSSALFTLAHLPNLPLTFLTFFGALLFTDLFRRFRSIYPLAIVHAMLGIAIAYSFPDSIMHHMRVGLSFGRF
jgi:membrane protease YdiL (CAAX protease family)